MNIANRIEQRAHLFSINANQRAKYSLIKKDGLYYAVMDEAWGVLDAGYVLAPGYKRLSQAIASAEKELQKTHYFWAA